MALVTMAILLLVCCGLPVDCRGRSRGSSGGRATGAERKDSSAVFTKRAFIKNDFKIGDRGTNKCPSGYYLLTNEHRCTEEAKHYLNYPFGGRGCWGFSKGCFTDLHKVYLNTCFQKVASHHHPVCVKGKRKETDEAIKIGDSGTDKCPSGYHLLTIENACMFFTKRLLPFKKAGCWGFSKGCFTDGVNIYFNTCYKDIASHHRPLCMKGEGSYYDKAFKIGDKGTDKCPSGYRLLTDEKTCTSGTRRILPFTEAGCWGFSKGCFTDGVTIYFNTCKKSIASHHRPVCIKDGRLGWSTGGTNWYKRALKESPASELLV